MPAHRSTIAIEISLPDLTPFDAEGLGAGGDYVAIDFVGLDFAGADAPDARFLECRLQRCGLDGASLRRARIAESLLSDLHAREPARGDHRPLPARRPGAAPRRTAWSRDPARSRHRPGRLGFRTCP